MKRRLLKALAAPIGLLVGAGIGATILHLDIIEPATPAASDVMEGRESVVIPGEARMARMIENETCWTGGEGRPVPGHVWLRISRNGGAAYVLRGEAAVADSLNQIFEGADNGLDIVAFCL